MTGKGGGWTGTAAVIGCLLATATAGAQPVSGEVAVPSSATSMSTSTSTSSATAIAAVYPKPRIGSPTGEPDETALREALARALWPADIVRLADDYLRLYPQHDGAAEATRLRQHAQAGAEALRRHEVQLFRAAFSAPVAEGAAADAARRQAALGDAAAALRVAHQLQADNAGARRALGWLQYASALGSDRAAYELALHYRRAAQPLLAAQYEARALELGFDPPRALDHLRK